MPCVGFEPTVPASERAKTVHALHRSATVTGVSVVPVKKCIANPITGCGGPWGSEMSRLPYFVENRLTDSGEIVNLTHLPSFTARRTPGTHFCLRLNRPQGHSGAGKIRSIGKSNYFAENRTRDFQSCSIVPEPTTLPRDPIVPVGLLS
jgi:hypothetical protein